jgi:hypothetical protein
MQVPYYVLPLVPVLDLERRIIGILLAASVPVGMWEGIGRNTELEHPICPCAHGNIDGDEVCSVKYDGVHKGQACTLVVGEV